MTQPTQSNSPDTEILGILINNLGTPDSYQVNDVKKFLHEFLWDPRVVKVSRPLWWLILNIIILNTRPKKSAAAYKKLWSEQGSPLLAISKKQSALIRQTLHKANADTRVELGMRYGNPSIEKGLNKLRDAGATRFLIAPLYPQFSYTTTASVEDEVARVLKKWNLQKWSGQNFKIIKHYFDNPDYIEALAKSVATYWDKHGKAEKLLMSFHGIPQKYADDGDPYAIECQQTAQLLAQSLNLKPDQWQIGFQSRLGYKKWLTPYTDHTLQQLGKQGTQSIQVICPGFSADCLETLIEIAMEKRDVFLAAGGKKYSYIPCLNDSEAHIKMLSNQIIQQLM